MSAHLPVEEVEDNPARAIEEWLQFRHLNRYYPEFIPHLLAMIIQRLDGAAGRNTTIAQVFATAATPPEKTPDPNSLEYWTSGSQQIP